jgi:hypothetical protein
MMDFAAYKTAIKTWVEAQSGLIAQWRDESGGWQGKPRIRLHLMSSAPLGVDWLGYDLDEGLEDGSDFVPTVRGNRTLTLSILCETRNQTSNNTASYYLEKLRTSLKKPSVRTGLYAAGLVVSSSEAVQDLAAWVDDRVESEAQLDVHLATVVNSKDEAEAGSYADRMTATAEFTTPADDAVGWTDEEIP